MAVFAESAEFSRRGYGRLPAHNVWSQHLFFVQGFIKAGRRSTPDVVATSAFGVHEHLVVVRLPLMKGFQRLSIRVVIADNPGVCLDAPFYEPDMPSVGRIPGFRGMDAQDSSAGLLTPH